MSGARTGVREPGEALLARCDGFVRQYGIITGKSNESLAIGHQV